MTNWTFLENHKLNFELWGKLHIIYTLVLITNY